MPDKETLKRVRQDQTKGKSPSTQAGEFVREEIEHIREGKHGARSAKQAIAIGLSKARRAGIKLPAPEPGSVSAETRKQAARDTARGQADTQPAPSRKRSRAATEALKKESPQAASKLALSRQARASARKRSAAERSRSAQKGAKTRAAQTG